MVRAALLIVAGIAAGIVLAGCGRPAWHSDEHDPVPADFSVVFTVLSDDDATADPLRMSSHYVLESDRTLRVALGPGAAGRTFPPPTATLSPGQVESLYRIVQRHGLLEVLDAAPESPGDPVRYRIAITSNGGQRRYVTTPEASRGARALLTRLIELRGGLPPRSPEL